MSDLDAPTLFPSDDADSWPPCANPPCGNPGTVALTLYGKPVANVCKACAPTAPSRVWARPARKPTPAQVVDAMDTEPPRLHRGASRAQRESIEGIDPATLSSKRAKTLAMVAAHADGATCDALEAEHGVSHQSLSARLNWLERHGLILRDLDDLRPTRSGRSANPYHLTEDGAEALAELRRRGR